MKYHRWAHGGLRARQGLKCSISCKRTCENRLQRLLPTDYFHVVFTVRLDVRSVAGR
ncbi:MAG: hypothetical protein ACT4TC_09985 [Myxococcaceae bacterium]